MLEISTALYSNFKRGKCLSHVGREGPGADEDNVLVPQRSYNSGGGNN